MTMMMTSKIRTEEQVEIKFRYLKKILLFKIKAQFNLSKKTCERLLKVTWGRTRQTKVLSQTKIIKSRIRM